MIFALALASRRAVNFILRHTAGSLVPTALVLIGLASLAAADTADPLSEPIETLKPTVARSEAETDRVQAQAEFAAGRMLEQRDDIAGALRRYQRAARYDPNAVPILRSVVDMGVRLHRNAEATRYALRYAELDASNPSLLHGLARILSAEENRGQAIKLYQRALASSENLPPDAERVEMLLELGRLQFLGKEYAAAAQTLTQLSDALQHPDRFRLSPAVIKDFTADGVIDQLLGESLLESGQPDAAAAVFAKQDSKTPASADALWHAARLAFGRKQFLQAAQSLDKYFATGNAEQGTAPYELLAEILKAQGKSAELIPQLVKLHDDHRDNLLLTFALADRLREAGQLDQARPLYAQLIEKKPVVEAFSGGLDVERRDKQPAAALKVLGRAADEFHTSLLAALGESAERLIADAEQFDALLVAARAAGSTLDGSTALAVAALAGKARKFDVASEFFELGLKNPPPDAPDWFRYWGVELFSAEKFAEASAIFQRGIDAKPAVKLHSDLLYLLGTSLAFEDKTNLALSAARKAAALDSRSVRLRARIGWIQYHAKRNDDAYRSYKDLIERFGQNEAEEDREQLREARQILSSLAVTRGDLTEANEWLEQVLDEFPDDAGASNDLGYLWADQSKHLTRAMQMIQLAVDAEPENLAFRDSLGWAYFRLDRLADAERELQRAAADDKADGAVLEHLADVLVKSKQPQPAADAYRRSIAAFEKDDSPARAEAVKKKLAELAN